MISVFRPFDIEEEKRRISGDSEDSGVNSSSDESKGGRRTAKRTHEDGRCSDKCESSNCSSASSPSVEMTSSDDEVIVVDNEYQNSHLIKAMNGFWRPPVEELSTSSSQSYTSTSPSSPGNSSSDNGSISNRIAFWPFLVKALCQQYFTLYF